MVSPEKVRCQPLAKTQLLMCESQRAEEAKMRRWRTKVVGSNSKMVRFAKMSSIGVEVLVIEDA